MNLECLRDYIGLDTAGEESGLALVNLPGISMNNFGGIKNDTYEDDTALWNTIQNRSLRKLLTNTTSRMNECFKITDLEIIECLVCDKLELFANAFWYLLGAETMIERIYSDRVNRWTSIDIEEARDLLAYYTTQYENELQLAVNGLDPKNSDCLEDEPCLQCNDKIRFVEGII